VLENIQYIKLPTDIRGLIESVYDSTHDNKAYQPYLKNLNDKKSRLRNFALQGLSSVNKTMPEEAVQTRFSDIETIDVLLVKKIEFNAEDERQNKGTILTLLNSKKIFLPLNGRLLEKNLIKTISELSLQIVKMPSYQIEKNKRQTYHNLLWLKDYFYIGKEDDLTAPLLVCIVNNDDSILLSHSKEKTNTNYNNFLGLFK
jgi:CRISPR-associated endonuclease/helicase Cas3